MFWGWGTTSRSTRYQRDITYLYDGVKLEWNIKNITKCIKHMAKTCVYIYIYIYICTYMYMYIKLNVNARLIRIWA